jgi:hypothetical protein
VKPAGAGTPDAPAAFPLVVLLEMPRRTYCSSYRAATPQ